MTDPIQTGNPQQQGTAQTSQQPVTDNIPAWVNNFADMPQIQVNNENDLPYDDLLDEKYTFDPIPEEIPEQKSEPIPEQKSDPIPEPIPEPVAIPEENIPEDIVEEEVQDIPQQSDANEVQEEHIPEPKLQTDIQKKFGELFSTTKRIYGLKDRLWLTEETFDILWADNDKVFISYRFQLDETSDPILFITKIEQDKDTEEETTNELKFTFNEETLSLEVMINDILLFDEIQDLTEDQKKKLQVVDKLNKFIFLSSEELRKIEKEIKEREETERERKKLQEIFRNF